MFRHPVPVHAGGAIVERDGFVFADLLPAGEGDGSQEVVRSLLLAALACSRVARARHTRRSAWPR